MGEYFCFWKNENLNEDIFAVFSKDFERAYALARLNYSTATFCGDITFDEILKDKIQLFVDSPINNCI